MGGVRYFSRSEIFKRGLAPEYCWETFVKGYDGLAL